MNTVLVVDDNSEILEALSLILDDAGYNVVTAQEPHRAVALCEEVGFDAVICDLCMLEDLSMPETLSLATGMEAIWALREQHPNVPIIAMSGMVDSSTLERLRGLGLSGVLEKPFTSEDLLNVVRLAVRNNERTF